MFILGAQWRVGEFKEVITPWALADQYASEEDKTKSKKAYNFGGSVF